MKTELFDTFWKIIQHNKIEIPTIQRDYAYGRKSAARIRKNIVSDFENCLNNNTPIHLDFVYGKLAGKENEISLERNKNNIQSLLNTIKSYASDFNVKINYELISQSYLEQNNVTFIPLDGQQRLTTLFLLHWYIAQRNHDIESLNTLKKFTYSTRISSKDFCNMLCNKVIKILPSTKTVSEIICNQEEYFSFWKHDPTVKSMLIVIDEIHQTFNKNDKNYDDCWNSLTKNDLITFDFFDLENFELTDELYIKMNARGKPLSHFENFKAWLIKTHHDLIIIEDWKKKFDIQWNDLFWKVKDESSYSIDNEYFQYFNTLYLGDYMKSLNVKESDMNDYLELENYNSDTIIEEDFKTIIGVLRKSNSNSISLFSDNELFKTNINSYLNLLDLFKDISIVEFDKNSKKLTNKYISTELSKLLFGAKLNSLNWWDITLHYSLTRYLIKNSKIDSNFLQWTRITSNLIYNSKIDSPKLFIDAIKSLDSLMEKIDIQKSVYSSLSILTDDDISFFSSQQKFEEIKKAKLILSHPAWEEELIIAENHTYFYGQIGFILNLNSELSLNIFKDSFKKLSALFSEEVLDNKDWVLTRSFLSLGDCFYKEGDNLVFNSNVRGTLRNRNENWRKFFENKQDYIKMMISHQLFDSSAIIPALNKIIKNQVPLIQDEYRKLIVSNPKLLDYARKHCIGTYEKGYYILNSTRFSGYFVELYTYDWFIKYKTKFMDENPAFDSSYGFVKGFDNDPYIEFKSKSLKIDYKLFRDCGTGKFELKNGSNTSVFTNIRAAVLSITKNHA